MKIISSMMYMIGTKFKPVTCCFLAGRGEDCGTGEGDSIGLFVPDPEDPTSEVPSDVVASDG